MRGEVRGSCGLFVPVALWGGACSEGGLIPSLENFFTRLVISLSLSKGHSLTPALHILPRDPDMITVQPMGKAFLGLTV